MKIKNITSYLESIAPLSYQESYDNAGLIVGDPNAECTGVLVCLDSIESIIDEAIEKGCNLVVAHHPIVFGGLKKFNGRNYVERTVIKAIKADIAIYAIHTNLDNVHLGVNKRICDRLGLEDTQILAPKANLLKKLYTFCPSDQSEAVRAAIFSAGAGQIGDYDECSYNVRGIGTFKAGENTDPYVGEVGKQHQEEEVKIETIFPAYLQSKVIAALNEAHPYEEVAYDVISLDNVYNKVGSGMIGELKEPIAMGDFLYMLKDRMGVDVIRHTSFHQKEVKKVAVCGGAGSFLLRQAIGQGADIFITADYKYHQFFDADGRIVIADIGHYESEQYTIELLSELIRKKFSKFVVFLTEINTNPVKYYY